MNEKKTGRPEGRKIVHGTNTGYVYGCRCEECKKAHALKNYEANKQYALTHKRKPKPPTDRKIRKKANSIPVSYSFIGKRPNGSR